MSEVARKKQPQSDGIQRNEKKWTKELLDAGWSALPNVILEFQQVLQLDAVDVNIILHLVRHWWYAEKLPHPSKQTIADCMGVDPSTIRRRIAKLEQRGLISRVKRSDARFGQKSNEYDMSGLIKAATPHARAATVERNQRKKKDSKARIVGSRAFGVVHPDE